MADGPKNDVDAAVGLHRGGPYERDLGGGEQRAERGGEAVVVDEARAEGVVGGVVEDEEGPVGAARGEAEGLGDGRGVGEVGNGGRREEEVGWASMKSLRK